MQICILSQQHFRNRHVSEDTIDAFESALLKENDVTKIQISELLFKLNRKLFSRRSGPLIDRKTLRTVKRLAPDYVFIMAMAPGALRYQINTLKRIHVPKVVYCVDTWESRLDEWRNLLSKAGVDYVLCSNIRSVPTFKKFIKHVEYLPYSMNEKYFYPRDLEKTRLFMQMGRKNSTLDQYVLRYLHDHNLSDTEYIRETELGKIIFPDFNTLAEEINKTKFFIVSPRDIDESDITGSISDVTARFYEGMACKTMLIGYKPKDSFDMLFPDKQAMISVSGYEDFSSKIDYYLTHSAEYRRILDHNHQQLMENHTWAHRAAKLLGWLKGEGNSGDDI